jgi:hypothetical protein
MCCPYSQHINLLVVHSVSDEEPPPGIASENTKTATEPIGDNPSNNHWLDDGLDCWWVLSAGCAPLGLMGKGFALDQPPLGFALELPPMADFSFSDFLFLGFTHFRGLIPPHFGG